MNDRDPTGAALARACGQFRRAVGTALFADGALRGLAVSAACWGVGALAARAATGALPAWMPAAAACMPLCAVLGGIVVRQRHIPTLHQARIAVDSLDHAGGLIVTSGQPGHAAWLNRIGEPRTPSVRRRQRPLLLACAATLAFALAAALLPDRKPPPTGPSMLDVRRTVEELQAQTEVVEEARIIEPEVADEIGKQLEQLWEQASGDDPARTYEALDHLAAALRQDVATAAEEMIRQAEQLAAFEAAAEALARMAADPGHDAQALQDALRELAEAIQANPELAALTSELAKSLPELLQASSISPEQLAKLAKQLGQCQNATQACMGKLCEARLLDPEALSKCKAAGACKSTDEAKDALLAYLQQNPGAEATALLACLTPRGNGGIDRGGGPSAGLAWTTETTADGAGFEEQALPPAPGDLADSRTVGLSASAPEVAPDGADTAARHGALAGAAAGPADAWRRTLLPRHRSAVERYFDRAKP